MVNEEGYWSTEEKKNGLDWIETLRRVRSDTMVRKASLNELKEELYAVLAMADQYGLDPLSMEVDQALEDAAASVGWLREETFDALGVIEESVRSEIPKSAKDSN
jgi:hypothetical protein